MQLRLRCVTLLSLVLFCDAALKWELHNDTNCFPGKGASVPYPWLNETIARSVDECKALCEATVPWGGNQCHGITVQWEESANGSHVRCWRRGDIQMKECNKTIDYVTWTLTGTPDTYPAVNWSRSGAVSCYQAHGATDLEYYLGVPFGRLSFPECKAMCNFLPDCEGVVLEFNDQYYDSNYGPMPNCYRRASINLSSCVRGDQEAWALPFDTWVKVKSDDEQPTGPEMAAQEAQSNVCSNLSAQNCTGNHQCRWCSTKPSNRTPGPRDTCIPQDFADEFLMDKSCDSPSPDPCGIYNPGEKCTSNGCRVCHDHEPGLPPDDFCASEVPTGEFVYCDDTLNHEAGYKTCAHLPIHGSARTTCQSTPVCAVCDFQVSTNLSRTVCVDKDSMGSWCKGGSGMQSVII